jgi:glycosyltransferase involved in cell wall biosynthesis
MRRIRVCTVVNNLDGGGLERVAIELIRGLDRSRFDLSLVCLNGRGRLFDVLDLPHDSVLVLHKRSPARTAMSVDVDVLRRIRRFLLDRQIDIVHAHNLAPLTYAGVAARTLRQRPRIVYTEHSGGRAVASRTAGRARRMRTGWYLRIPDLVVAVSIDLSRYLRDVLPASERLVVIHNGVDATGYESVDAAAVRQSLGIPAAAPLAGTVASLSAPKNLPLLLTAAAEVVRRLPQCRFVIAGDGPQRDALRAQAAALGLDNHLTFLGYRDDVSAILAALDVFVLSSAWEGLPLVLLEAMAAGKPIVATDVGGCREAIVDGVNGTLVPPDAADALANAIVRYCSDREAARRAGRHSRERFVERFSVRRMLQRYDEAFRDLVHLSAPRAGDDALHYDHTAKTRTAP